MARCAPLDRQADRRQTRCAVGWLLRTSNMVGGGVRRPWGLVGGGSSGWTLIQTYGVMRSRFHQISFVRSLSPARPSARGERQDIAQRR